MKKLEMIAQESYEAPAILDIQPVTIDYVAGDSLNDDPENMGGNGGGGSNEEEEP